MKKKVLISMLLLLSIGAIVALVSFLYEPDYTMNCQKLKCVERGNAYNCKSEFIRCANQEAVCYQYKNRSYDDAETFCFKK